MNRNGEILFTDGRLHGVLNVANARVATLAGNNIIDPCSQNIASRAREANRDGRAFVVGVEMAVIILRGGFEEADLHSDSWPYSR